MRPAHRPAPRHRPSPARRSLRSNFTSTASSPQRAHSPRRRGHHLRRVCVVLMPVPRHMPWLDNTAHARMTSLIGCITTAGQEARSLATGCGHRARLRGARACVCACIIRTQCRQIGVRWTDSRTERHSERCGGFGDSFDAQELHIGQQRSRTEQADGRHRCIAAQFIQTGCKRHTQHARLQMCAWRATAACACARRLVRARFACLGMASEPTVRSGAWGQRPYALDHPEYDELTATVRARSRLCQEMHWGVAPAAQVDTAGAVEPPEVLGVLA